MRPRTLVLRAEGGTVTYEVLRGADPLLGATDLTQPAAAQRTLDATVSTLVARGGGDAQDQGRALAALGIGYVLLPAPADAALAGTLNNVADLRPVSRTAGFQLWRVAQTTARVRVAEPGGKLVTVPSGPVSVSGVAAPRAGGTLELAEPAGGWTATLNGSALQSVPSPACAWAQAFRLPPGGGTLDISHSQLGRTLIIVLEGLALLVVIGLGLPGVRVPGESGAAATAERAAGRRRERGRDPAADGLGDPDLEPESPPGREDAEPSRGGRLSRRAVAAAGRAGTAGAGTAGAGTARAGTARAGGLRAAAGRVAGGPGRRAAAAGSGAAGPGTPGLSGPGPGAPPSGPGAGRRGTLGASRRSTRPENEDLTAAGGAGLARDTGPDATAGFGAEPAGWTGADAADGFDPAGWAGGDRLAAVPGPAAGDSSWEPDDSLTVLGDQPAAPWEETGRPPRAAPAAAELAGAGLAAAVKGAAAGGDQDAGRGGRKRWRLSRKAAAQNPPEPDAPDRNTGRRRGKRNAPEQEAAAEYPPDPYASSANLETAGTGPRRRRSERASGPYPVPAGGSGEHASGAGRGGVRRGGADDRVQDGQGWDTGAERVPAGYSRAGDDSAGDSGAGDDGAGFSGAGDDGAGGNGAGDDSAGFSGAGDDGAGYSGAGYDGAGGNGAGDDGAGGSGPGYGAAARSGSGPAGYVGTGYGPTGYGSGEYPQPGPEGARRVSRGRLPGDDDLLLPPRRGGASGGYPAGGVPATGSRPGGPGYPDAASADAPDYPGLAGPGDSPRSDPGRGSPARGGYRDDSPRSDPGGASGAWGGYPG